MPSLAEAKAAALRHDQINVRAVALLLLLTLLSFARPTLGPTLSKTTLVYMLGDCAYNIALPHCQPTRARYATILLHHAFTIVLVLLPIQHPELSRFTGLAMLVEVNTLLHNANKVFKRPSLAVAFYASWVILRLVYYPFLLVVFHRALISYTSLQYAQGVGSFAALCLLNFWWTGEVVVGIMRPKTTKPS
jgi:hypothetical protein